MPVNHYAPVAQRIEQMNSNHLVGGSIPSGRTSNNSALVPSRQMKKKLKIAVIVFVFFLLAIFLERSSMIFQEGNPLPVAYAIIKLSMSENGYTKIDEYKYITYSKASDIKNLEYYLRKNNIIHVDQMGSGHIYKDKDGKRYTAEARMYSTAFMIWDFSYSVKQGLHLP